MWSRIRSFETLQKTGLILFLLIGLVLVNGCGKKDAQTKGEDGKKLVVQKGDTVKVDYTGSLEDGTVFDQSREGQPLEFTVGFGQLIPGFDQAVEGMKLNEEKEVVIKPENAYGMRDESLVRPFPRSFFPKDFKAEIGMGITLQDQTGRQIPARIADIREDSIDIDLNNPLAEKELTFKIKIVEIR
ncbi:MAG TPA: peptidylprolyl isomerase [archaeon]|nr:peptidylprolyl isomerase [archaeon]